MTLILEWGPRAYNQSLFLLDVRFFRNVLQIKGKRVFTGKQKSEKVPWEYHLYGLCEIMFDTFADVYEAMIEWPKRLAHEGPFYRKWFDRAGVKNALDAACGSGHHVALFHSWGLTVEGADASRPMIELAQARFGQPPGLCWSIRSFDQQIPAESPWDAVVCVGNSLSLAADEATVERSVQRMFEALRPGGLLVIHLLNLWRLPDGPCVWQKCQRAPISHPTTGTEAVVGETLGNKENGVPTTASVPVSPTSDSLILKGVHRCGRRGFVEVAVADLSGRDPLRSESTPFLGIEAPDLQRMAGNAGAKKIYFFGGYQDEPFLREKSVDLILVAEK
jgi:SAM-dependent methyltransferase